MKYPLNTAGLTLQLLILLAVVFVVLSPVAPLYEPVPARDQGVYLYIGQQILDGKIPYRDVWDHKGPLVYYINALGLWTTDSVWGVWLLEVLFLFLAAVSSLLALRAAFDPLTAFSSTILWLAVFPRVLDHGNSVEEYSLLFQFAAVYFFLHMLRTEKTSKSYWNEWMIGVTAALAFSLRPSNIGIHLAIGLALAAMLFSPKERNSTLKRIAAAASGSGMVFAVIAIYYAAHNSLDDLLDQVFFFNYLYSSSEKFSWSAVTKGYTSLAFLTPLGLAGLPGLAGYFLAYRKQDDKERDVKIRFALFMLAVIPIQTYLSLMSGRKYLHYYIAWLPVLALLVGFLISWVQGLAGRIFTDHRHKLVLNILFAGGLVLAFGAGPIVNRIPRLTNLANAIRLEGAFPPPDYSKVEKGEYVEYILTHTRPGDYVLIWGSASVYNFLTERESPSRFVYTYAFGVPSYVSQEMVDEMLRDIAEKKPMILDATSEGGTINRIDSNLWKGLPATWRLVRFIEENYHQVDRIGPDRFRVWVPKGD